MICIVSAGLGNIGSVRNMLARAGCGEARIVSEPGDLVEARKVILPGVGSFDWGVEALARSGMDKAIRAAAAGGAYIFGICLGMQLLFEKSEEGRLPGLGIIPGSVVRFRFEGGDLKVPHVGWNRVRPAKGSVLFDPDGEELRFYHVHAYHALCRDAEDVAATTQYGYEFASAVERGRVLGVQFHPEKSHRFGIQLMKRFVELD